MGWANCGEDSRGRPIGYAVEATCDEPGCTKEIDRGLGYACGGMHGEDEFSCENYYCEDHLTGTVWDGRRLAPVCSTCVAGLRMAVAEDAAAGVDGWKCNEEDEIFFYSGYGDYPTK